MVTQWMFEPGWLISGSAKQTLFQLQKAQQQLELCNCLKRLDPSQIISQAKGFPVFAKGKAFQDACKLTWCHYPNHALASL